MHTTTDAASVDSDWQNMTPQDRAKMLRALRRMQRRLRRISRRTRAHKAPSPDEAFLCGDDMRAAYRCEV